MDEHEHISNGIQKFYGINYAYWSDRVKTYLTALGVDIWYSVVNGYIIPNNAPTDPNEKNLMSCNSKARHVILAALAPTIARKVMAREERVLLDCCKGGTSVANIQAQGIRTRLMF
jgi:hypothetical protein